MATSGARAGATEAQIMNQTGHKRLPVLRRFIRTGSSYKPSRARTAEHTRSYKSTDSQRAENLAPFIPSRSRSSLASPTPSTVRACLGAPSAGAWSELCEVETRQRDRVPQSRFLCAGRTRTTRSEKCAPIRTLPCHVRGVTGREAQPLVAHPYDDIPGGRIVNATFRWYVCDLRSTHR
jgi:hypothetical protein